MKNKLLTLLILIVLPLFFIKPAFAGFGVSPAEIYNDSLKPGAKFEKEIVLSRSETDETLNVVIDTELGDMESWIKFDQGKEFTFPKGETRKTIKAIISVPNNANLKNYKGTLRIKAFSADSSNSGVSIIKGARMEVTLVTTSINIDVLDVKNLSISDTDFQKPIKLIASIHNGGNTEIAPSKIILEIQDLTKKVIETQEVTRLEKISPNTTKEITAEFKNNLNGGEYFGNVKVYLDDKLLRSDRLVFKINNAPEGYKSVDSKSNNVFNKIASIVKENKNEAVAVPVILLIPIVTGFALFKGSKSIHFKIIFFVATLGYLLITSSLLTVYHQYRLQNMAKPGDAGNVKGETIDTTKVKSESSLIINEEVATYPIYRTPDLNSVVVYKASENEKLNIIREIDGWYEVSISKGTGGWLPKSSVKKIQ